MRIFLPFVEPLMQTAVAIGECFMLVVFDNWTVTM